MAYFANGSQGMAFNEQCDRCVGREKACPIAFVQLEFNYEAVNFVLASEILGHLVKNDGTCTMYKTFEAQLSAEHD